MGFLLYGPESEALHHIQLIRLCSAVQAWGKVERVDQIKSGAAPLVRCAHKASVITGTKPESTLCKCCISWALRTALCVCVCMHRCVFQTDVLKLSLFELGRQLFPETWTCDFSAQWIPLSWPPVCLAHTGHLTTAGLVGESLGNQRALPILVGWGKWISPSCLPSSGGVVTLTPQLYHVKNHQTVGRANTGRAGFPLENAALSKPQISWNIFSMKSAIFKILKQLFKMWCNRLYEI